MFITEEMITKLKENFGQPKEVRFRFPVEQKEFDRIKSSQKNGRQHDVTLYIQKDDSFVVIAKHFYPKGMFRAPSGGINPGEDFIEGAKREALEETGCEIEINRFLLLTDVTFYLKNKPEKKIEWNSFVFLADYVAGDFQFTDKNEIREVAVVTIEDFEKYSAMMRQTDIGGLNYRAALHDEVKKTMLDAN